MTTAWSHLPNASAIDRVLAEIPKLISARDAARDAARGAARDAARDAAWVAARGAARDAAWGAAWGAARDAAWGAITALVVYDDSAVFLGYSPDELRALLALDEIPAARLMLPYALLKSAEKVE